MATFKLHVNGETQVVEAEPATPLLWVLRDQLRLTGAKHGCGEGQCGACTVLIDRTAVNSCVTSVSSVRDGRITTIEGLATAGRLHPLQRAFLDKAAFQCGFCTSGMIMAGVALLERNPEPTDDDTRQHLEGNICRCGTYPRIVQAVRLASRTVSDA